jgi:hypothetical protein
LAGFDELRKTAAAAGSSQRVFTSSNAALRISVTGKFCRKAVWRAEARGAGVRGVVALFRA